MAKKTVSIDDVKNLTQEEAKKIYIARYWNPMNMDKVNHQPLAETIFDMGVNAGIGRAGKKTYQKHNPDKENDRGRFAVLSQDEEQAYKWASGTRKAVS